MLIRRAQVTPKYRRSYAHCQTALDRNRGIYEQWCLMHTGPSILLDTNAPLVTPVKAARRGTRQWLRALSPVGLLALWQVASYAGWISSHTLASPGQVIASLWQLTADGVLQQHLLVSLGRVAKAMALAVLIGGSLALISGLSRVGEYIIDAPMQMLRTLPVLALIPLFIVWFGIGELPKVALVTVAATFPIYLTLFAGIRGVDPKLVELAKVIGLPHSALVRHVILPAALPTALVGLRYSLGISWLILVAAEQVNATSGIGYLMNDARDFMRTDILVLGLLIYAALGLLVDILVRWLERRLLAWRPSFMQSAA
jgi:sulfonate transport system permease protein